MTVKDVEARLDEIRAEAHDDESAHSMEDGLRADVLKAIAEGGGWQGELATAVLESDEIDFERRCA